MPPKPKFTREEIISASLDLVRENGISALTTRSIAERLNSSARPIFTVFKNMDELTAEVRNAAMRLYESYIEEKTGDMPLFKQAGMQMLSFSLREPKLYQFLFMSENKSAVSFDDVFVWLGKTAEYCIDVICEEHMIEREDAYRLFEAMWIYTHGIGSLCATGTCKFSKDKLSRMLSTEFAAMLKFIKSGDEYMLGGLI